MLDMSDFIAPKSNQLNADDLIGGPRTIRITKVTANPSGPEQPVAIGYEGDDGKPYYPCKSMRRVMVNAWGKDTSVYPGRSMTIYRDAQVVFGGMAVGGIRISHMSHIDSKMTMALTATRAQRKPYTVQPLATGAAGAKSERQVSQTEATGEGVLADAASAETAMDQLYALKARVNAAANKAEVTAAYESAPEEGWSPEMYDELNETVAARLKALRKPAMEPAQ